MAADDRDTPLPSGWLPPRAPAPAPRPPERPVLTPERRPVTEPSSPALVSAIVLGSLSLLLLALSVGASFFGSLVLSAMALTVATRLRDAIRAGRPGRESQARAAVIVAWIGVALSIVAGIVWIALWANGVTPQDLQETLEREFERRRNRG